MATNIGERPASISGCMQSWNEKKTPLTIRTVMENPSTVKVRRRYTTAIFNIDATLSMAAELYDDFMAWYEVACFSGVYPTQIRRPRDGVEIVARFTEPPVIEWIDKGAFRATMRFEQLPEWAGLVAPENTALPIISGAVWAGSLLSVSNGSWFGGMPMTFQYEWKRGDVIIGTASTYTSQYEDSVGITCKVTATNEFGVGSAVSTTFYPDERAASFDLKVYPLDSRITFTRTTTATYWDENGVMQTAAIGEPRPYRLASGGAILGLMIEEASTNSVRNNIAQGAVVGVIGAGGSLPSTWFFGAVSGCTREIVAIGVEDGIDYIDVRLNGTVDAASQALSVGAESSNSIATVQNDSWTLSTFCKLAAGSLTGMNISQMVNEYSGVYLESNISNSFTPTADSLSKQRRQFTSVMSNAAATFVQPIPIYSTLANGLVVDVTLRIGMPQMEKKAVATSVIKTTTAAVTRAADSPTVTDTNFSDWFNATEGTFLVNYCFPETVLKQRTILSANDNNFSNRIYCYTTAANQTKTTVRVNNGAELDPTAPFATTGAGNYKAAYGYSANYINQSINGILSTADTSGELPTAGVIDRLSIGKNHNETDILNGYIVIIDCYNKRVPDSKLLELSQP